MEYSTRREAVVGTVVVAVHHGVMRIAIVDESDARALVIREGLAAIAGCEVFVLTERRGLVAEIAGSRPTWS